MEGVMANRNGKSRTGLKITNPLSRAVRVRIKSATGALHTGDGKETWRTIKPGETLYIPTKGKCELDITVQIIRYNEVGDPVKLDDGAIVPVAQQVKPGANPKPAGPGPFRISEQRNLKSGRWVIVAQWVITKERSGIIRDVLIQLDGDCEALVIIGRHPPVKVKADWQTVQKDVWINEGESVKVKAHAVGGGQGVCQVIIRGELYHIEKGKSPKPAPERVPEPDTEETPLRSLGDMLDAMKKSEEEVKV